MVEYQHVLHAEHSTEM